MKQELKDWIVNGKPAGKTRSAKGFTFATIAGAGHMVRVLFLFVLPKKGTFLFLSFSFVSPFTCVLTKFLFSGTI